MVYRLYIIHSQLQSNTVSRKIKVKVVKPLLKLSGKFSIVIITVKPCDNGADIYVYHS